VQPSKYLHPSQFLFVNIVVIQQSPGLGIKISSILEISIFIHLLILLINYIDNNTLQI